MASRRALMFAGTLLALAILATTGGALRSSSGIHSRKPSSLSPLMAKPSRALQASSFACGTLRCDPQTSYCETLKTDVPELPSDYACRPLPRACLPNAEDPPRDCKCFPRGTRGDFCASPIHNGVRTFYRATIGGR